MAITLGYTETRNSSIPVEHAEILDILCEHGAHDASHYQGHSERELAADLTDELADPASNLPAALENLVDDCAEISHRAWTIN